MCPSGRFKLAKENGWVGLKFWTTLIIQLVTVATISWGAVKATGGAIFEAELERFHQEARPAIEMLIDSKIATHQAEQLLQYQADAMKLSARMSVMETQISSITSQLLRIERMLEAIYERR